MTSLVVSAESCGIGWLRAESVTVAAGWEDDDSAMVFCVWAAEAAWKASCSVRCVFLSLEGVLLRGCLCLRILVDGSLAVSESISCLVGTWSEYGWVSCVSVSESDGVWWMRW